MNILSEAETLELATQLVCGEFKVQSEAILKLDALDVNARTSVSIVARPLAEERLHKARESNDPTKINHELRRVAEVAQSLSDYPTANAMMEECIALEKKHFGVEPLTYSIAAGMLQEQGNLSKARQYQEEAVQIARNETQIDGLTADMLYHLGTIAVAQGELEYSRRCFAESLAFRQSWKQRYPESNDDRVRFLTYYEFAKILLTHEQAIPAIALLAAAQRIGESIEDAENFHEHTLFQELLAQAREMTEESTFALVWSEGLSLELEEIQTRFFSD